MRIGQPSSSAPEHAGLMLRLSAYLIMVDNEANFLQCPLVSMDYIILVAILDIAEKDQISTNPFHVHNLQ